MASGEWVGSVAQPMMSNASRRKKGFMRGIVFGVVEVGKEN